MSKNPRIAVTVSESQYRVLERLARVNKQSMSRVVGELVEMVEPVLDRVASLCEFAERARDEQREGLRRTMEETQAELEPLLLRALKVVGVAPGEVGELLGRRKRAAAGAGAVKASEGQAPEAERPQAGAPAPVGAVDPPLHARE